MLFGNLSKSSNKNIFLGSPEAEAEATLHSRVKLTEVYKDWHDLFNLLAYEKFIVVGRKGAGKSAFARFAQVKSLVEPNIFIDFITQNKINLEILVQTGAENGHKFSKETIFKWLIYTHIVDLFSQTESAKEGNDYEQLRQFLRKNRGFVDISDMEVTELDSRSGFEVNIEPLKRFYRQKIKKDINIKSQKAPFYKLLPHLEEIILAVFNSPIEKNNKNSYIVFFDDLDVGFDVSNKETVDNVVSLLRVCKHINNDVFGKNGINAKAIILLREDVEKYIADKYSDTAKIMASYSAHINWYQDDFQKGDNESELNIKKFIDLRIEKAFEFANLPCIKSNPWKSLVDCDEYYNNKSSFKYVLDHTLFRPRDLLLFFAPLEKGLMQIPLKKKTVMDLLERYSSQIVKEFRNEISSFYSEQEITQIVKFLGKLNDSYSGIEYSAALNLIDSGKFNGKEGEDILSDLFDRSIIGALEKVNTFKFKYREPGDGSEIYKLNSNNKIVLHYGFRAHFQKIKK